MFQEKNILFNNAIIIFFHRILLVIWNLLSSFPFPSNLTKNVVISFIFARQYFETTSQKMAKEGNCEFLEAEYYWTLEYTQLFFKNINSVIKSYNTDK